MPQEIKCIICDHSATIKIENLEGYQEGENYEIFYCSSCDTSFASPHNINEEIYDHIYSQVNAIPGYNRYALYAKEIINSKEPLNYLAGKEANYFAIKEILSGYADKNINLLEVGSGLGYLTYAIAQNGYNITGLDISPDAVKKAEMQFGNHYVCQDVYQYALDNAGKFDLVILTEVIEHVPDPKGFCDTLISLLKPGGNLLITTPNKSAFSSTEFWETELPPVHLTWFSESSFRSIAKQKNLAVNFFDYSNYNKKNIDVSRFIFYNQFYKIKKRVHVLDRDGEVSFPALLTNNNTSTEKIKTIIKQLLKPVFISLLTTKKNSNRNGVLAVILQNK